MKRKRINARRRKDSKEVMSYKYIYRQEDSTGNETKCESKIRHDTCDAGEIKWKELSVKQTHMCIHAWVLR